MGTWTIHINGITSTFYWMLYKCEFVSNTFTHMDDHVSSVLLVLLPLLQMSWRIHQWNVGDGNVEISYPLLSRASYRIWVSSQEEEKFHHEDITCAFKLFQIEHTLQFYFNRNNIQNMSLYFRSIKCKQLESENRTKISAAVPVGSFQPLKGTGMYWICCCAEEIYSNF